MENKTWWRYGSDVARGMETMITWYQFQEVCRLAQENENTTDCILEQMWAEKNGMA